VRRLVPVFLLVFLFAVPAAAQAKVHWLDTYEKKVKRYIGPLRTEKLDRNDPYVATVRGTFSFFAASAYNEPHCGVTEPRPIYKSRRRTNGRVNSDVEFLFADMTRNCTKRNKANPITAQTFQIAVGSKYVDYDPFGRGELTAPHRTHRYNYALIGKGRKAGFRLHDSFGEDNYGRIRIAIRRARTRDCVKGFAAFGYADEATCVAAVANARS
jgi:hypothetical protein